MAKPVCTYCDENQGVLLVTNLDDGETQVVCGGDLVMWSLSMASQLTQGMTLEQSWEHAEALDMLKANDVRPVKAAPRSKPRKSAPEQVPPSAPQAPEAVPPGRVTLPEPCELCGSLTAIGDADKLTCEGCDTVLATASESV